MTTSIVQLSAPYKGGLTGQIVGLPSAEATTLIGASGAALYDMGLGAGVPNLPAGGYQGQIASESTAAFLTRMPGGSLNPGDPVKAVENNPPVIVRGILQVS
jgi:hypothetical protein